MRRLSALFPFAIVTACSSGDDAGHDAACDDVNRVLRESCHMTDDPHGNPGTHNEAQRDDGSCHPEIARCLLRALSGRQLAQPDDCHQVIHLGDGAACGSTRD